MAGIWILLGVLALVGGFVYMAHLQEKKRTEALKGVADEMGFKFSPNADGALLSEMEGFHLFSQGRSKRVWNVMRGEAFSLRVALFDYRYTTGSGKHSHTSTQTVLCFWLPDANLPSFSLRPESFFHKIGQWLGYQDIDFDSHPRFSKDYLLRGSDEPAIRALFRPEVLEFFEQQVGISAEGRGNLLLYYRHQKRRKPENIRAMLEEGFKCMNLFRSGSSAETGERGS